MSRLVLLLAAACLAQGQQHSTVAELLRQFETATVFWRQFEVAKLIVTANDTSVRARLQSWLTHDDRHVRGNAAFVLAGLGDPRGFEVIAAILRDLSDRPEGQGIPNAAGPSEGKSARTVTMPPTCLAI